MRDDSILYTGVNSERLERREQKIKERGEAKVAKRTALTPAAEVVFNLIEKEKQEIVMSLMGFIQTDTTDKDLKSTILSLKMYSSYLLELQTKVRNVLRVKDGE